MVRIGKREKEHQRKVASERVDVLLSLAEKFAKERPERAKRYVELAWEIAKKHRVRLGKRKRRFCRKCFTYWTAGTLRVRLVHNPYPMVVYRCLVCGEEYRFPYVREKKMRAKKS